jgi:hypothetical protein
MLDLRIDFDAPLYLMLLAGLPIFWLVGRHSLRALQTWRQKAALFLRLAVAGMMVVALAEPNWLTLIRRLSVVFVVDADSIQREELAHALNYVNAAAQHRNPSRRQGRGIARIYGDKLVDSAHEAMARADTLYTVRPVRSRS